jgi:hypothetical protein
VRYLDTAATCSRASETVDFKTKHSEIIAGIGQFSHATRTIMQGTDSQFAGRLESQCAVENFAVQVNSKNESNLLVNRKKNKINVLENRKAFSAIILVQSEARRPFFQDHYSMYSMAHLGLDFLCTHRRHSCF